MNSGVYRRPLGAALAGWIVLSLLVAPGIYLETALSGRTPSVESALGAAFLRSFAWAVAAFLVLVFNRRLWERRVSGKTWYINQLLFGVGLVFVLLWLAWGWQWPVLGLEDARRTDGFWQALPAGLPRGFAIYLGVWGLCQAHLLRHAYRQIKRRFLSAELRRLRGQLNPHFLFNTLNAISELGYKDPDSADRVITQLSSLLRKSLDDSHQQEIALRDELDFLKRYLDIQQTLLQGSLQIEFDIANDTLSARVPGMILQPLAENAVTHGIGRSGSGYLKISAVRRDDLLMIEVQDNGWGLVIAEPHANREGIGIANTRARLRHLYGDLASLELHGRPGEGLTAYLNIPFHEAYAFDEDTYSDR
ncbi:MAG: histidine kinase [Gammaproteobacteria bacterium]